MNKDHAFYIQFCHSVCTTPSLFSKHFPLASLFSLQKPGGFRACQHIAPHTLSLSSGSLEFTDYGVRSLNLNKNQNSMFAIGLRTSVIVTRAIMTTKLHFFSCQRSNQIISDAVCSCTSELQKLTCFTWPRAFEASTQYYISHTEILQVNFSVKMQRQKKRCT